MKITRASDYAIRLLAHLAAGEVETTSGELSSELGIPFNHLAKLVQTLSRRGFLFTRKGRGGGLSLALDPKKINLADVIEAIEGPLVVSDCVGNKKSCRFSGKCKARQCFSKVRIKMRQVLAETYISDLAFQYS